VRTYEPDTGRLATLREGPALALGYAYHADGKVSVRADSIADREERFAYDGMERLERWKIVHKIPGAPGLPGGLGTVRDTSYAYDDIGNLKQVFVGGALAEDNTYGGNGRPHALTGNVHSVYFYDDRGRQEDAPGRAVTYTDFDLLQTITTPFGITRFSYDAGGARVKKSGPEGETVTLAGLYERRERAGGGLEHMFYVHGSEGPVAQVIQAEGSSKHVMTYVHTDLLGSVGALTDADGALLGEARYYEPFGARRDKDGGPAPGVSPVEAALGFTGHRHDDELGLIDMRGRVYDPALRRFITPDPHVTDPLDGQSYNRYSYVANDPVNRTDPTGVDWWDGSLGCIGMEGRPAAKGKSAERDAPRAQDRQGALTFLERIGQKAKQRKGERFSNLLSHIKVLLLKEAYNRLRKTAAPGVDGVTWRTYGENLDARLSDLQDRIHRGSYHPQPVRRVHIPKGDGRTRPLGIPTLEDKLVQQAARMILGPIYEQEFLGFSYGFRPGRSQHKALDALAVTIMRKVSWVLDADIRAFYDTIDHGWMQKFLEHTIADRRMVRLLTKWLHAGVMENGELREVDQGAPQGVESAP
jgi:RHS repeat-associated protein